MLFEPRYRKQARHLAHAGVKLWNYRRDQLDPADSKAILDGVASLREALRARDQARIESETEALDKTLARIAPPPKDAALRENIEVIVVALVIVFGGIRPYIAQPFKIPTGSMQPTLNGIKIARSDAPPPNLIVRLWHSVWFGRTHFSAVAPSGGAGILAVRQAKRFGLFAATRVQTDRGTFTLPGDPEIMAREFGLAGGRRYEPGEPIARGWIDAGDWLFVDKVSYHFRKPRRGEAFVFRTDGITELIQGQYYIKRLAGIPGDELRIDPPHLIVNGRKNPAPGFQRVASAKGDYGGYVNGGIRPDGRACFLNSPETPFQVPAGRYFALGDNSRNSSDGRYWGTVPYENLVGPAFVVYWPFGHHFGLVR